MLGLGYHIGVINDLGYWSVLLHRSDYPNKQPKKSGEKAFKIQAICIPKLLMDDMRTITTLNQSIFEPKYNQDYSVIESP